MRQWLECQLPAVGTLAHEPIVPSYTDRHGSGTSIGGDYGKRLRPALKKTNSLQWQQSNDIEPVGFFQDPKGCLTFDPPILRGIYQIYPQIHCSIVFSVKRGDFWGTWTPYLGTKPWCPILGPPSSLRSPRFGWAADGAEPGSEATLWPGAVEFHVPSALPCALAMATCGCWKHGGKMAVMAVDLWMIVDVFYMGKTRPRVFFWTC